MRSLWLSSAVLATSAFAAGATAPPPPPIFGPVMTAPFNQTIRIFGLAWNNYVQFAYDSTTKPVGSSIYIHSKGQNDEICTSVVGKEMSDEPCTLLASNDTWRYVIFPTSNECCRVCNTTDYCGIIRPDWLQQNSTYVGQATIGGVLCDGWMKMGGEQNYYFVTADARRQPCQYYEGYPTFNVGSNYWNFTYSAYSTNPIPASTFAVPTNLGCDALCARSSTSYSDRLKLRLALGVGGIRQEE